MKNVLRSVQDATAFKGKALEEIFVVFKVWPVFAADG